EQDSGLRIVLAHAAAGRPAFGGLSVGEALEQVRGAKAPKYGYRDNWWPVVAPISDDMSVNQTNANAEGVVTAKLAQALLAHETKDNRRATLPHELVEAYAADLGVDVAAEWKELQSTPPDPMLEEFFLLHQSDQLRDLAKELGKFMPETATRAGMVKLLLISLTGGSNTRFKLPKSVKPAGKRGK